VAWSSARQRRSVSERAVVRRLPLASVAVIVSASRTERWCRSDRFAADVNRSVGRRVTPATPEVAPLATRRPRQRATPRTVHASEHVRATRSPRRRTVPTRCLAMGASRSFGATVSLGAGTGAGGRTGGATAGSETVSHPTTLSTASATTVSTPRPHATVSAVASRVRIVVAVAAVEQVGAPAAVDGVVAVVAEQRVGARVPGQRIVGGAAVHVVHVAVEQIALSGLAVVALAVERDRHGRDAVAVVGHVEAGVIRTAGVADELVGARPAIEDVVSGLAKHAVVAIAAAAARCSYRLPAIVRNSGTALSQCASCTNPRGAQRAAGMPRSSGDKPARRPG